MAAICRSLSGHQTSASITVPGASNVPTIVHGALVEPERLPDREPLRRRRPSACARAAPTIISSRPGSGARPSTTRTCGWTRNAAGVTPRSEHRQDASGSRRPAAARSSGALPGDTYGTPARCLMPGTLASDERRARSGSISLRSKLSSLPAPSRMTFRSPPLTSRLCSIPRTNAAGRQHEQHDQHAAGDAQRQPHRRAAEVADGVIPGQTSRHRVSLHVQQRAVSHTARNHAVISLPRRLPRRHQPGDDAERRRQQQPEQQHARARGHLDAQALRSRGCSCSHRSSAAAATRPERAAEQAEQRASRRRSAARSAPPR